jgi:transposase
MCRWCVKKSGEQEAQALGRSRGGFSTKIHIAVDALGNPLRLLLTAGQRHDGPQAVRLIENFEPQVLIADKGYDSDDLIESVTAKGIEAVIPPKKSRLVQRAYDAHLYRERHLIECASSTRSSITEESSHDLISSQRTIWAS